MGGVSKLERQPSELREKIHAMFEERRTIDEVYAYLAGQGVETSRSGVDRFRRQWLKAAEAARDLERVAEIVVRDLAETPEHKTTRHMAELVKSGLLRALVSLEDRLEDEPEKTLVAFTEASRAVAALARADKDNVETVIKTAAFTGERARDAGRGDTDTIQVEFVPVPGNRAGDATDAPADPAAVDSGDTANTGDKPPHGAEPGKRP